MSHRVTSGMPKSKQAIAKVRTGENGISRLPTDQPELAWVESLTDLLDTKFTIPGTQVKFGADFILGLIPGVGDIVSLAFSGVLVSVMAKHGASKLLVARMLINVLFDATVGSVPILGNLFDLFYKANHRNMVLMREYYQEGKHAGSVWPLMIGVIAVILISIGLLIWALVTLISFSWKLIAASGTLREDTFIGIALQNPLFLGYPLL